MLRRSLAFVVLLSALLGTVLAAGPVAAQPQLPAGVVELHREARGAVTDVWLQIDASYFGPRGLDELWIENLQRQYLLELGEVEPGQPYAMRSVRLWAKAPAAIAGRSKDRKPFRLLVDLMTPPTPVPNKLGDLPAKPMAAAGTVSGVGQPGIVAGGLSGKTIYLSPGHGFTWTQSLNAWATQRGNTNGLVEDLLNAEAALHYLIPMLHNAGAKVVTVRERDLNTQMVVVDDAEGSLPSGAGYTEIGGPFQKGSNPGFAAGKAPYGDGDNPFVMGGYRVVPVVAGNPTATAKYVPDVPERGRYAVYLGYVAGSNRVTDAHVEIRHLGGTTHLRVDQTRTGGTWLYLGHYAFDAGISPDQGAVLLHNDSLQSPTGKYLIADVIRLGGGMGDVARGTGKPPASGPTSGRPRWEESCRTYAQFAGAPATVYDWSSSDPSDDVSCRSRMAAWVHESGEDALYLSWHTNAPAPARGTSTYVYGPNEPDGTYQFTGTAGSDDLAKVVHGAVVSDIKALWDSTWKDRGIFTAWFGEINPSHNNEMPSVLVEAAFHSTPADADALREPRFRHLLARALYKGIVTYFAQRDGLPVLLAPEPPVGVAVVQNAAGKATVQWSAGPSGGAYGQPATKYRVQTSLNGLGFDDGSETAATTLEVPLPPVGTPLFVRVVAVNAGGMSLPTATLGAAQACAGAKTALVVQGFTRLSASLAPIDDLSAFDLGQVQRLRQSRMNTFDYSIQHIQALAAAGLAVDSAERDALDPNNSASLLGTHTLVDWAAGEQSTLDGVLSESQKSALVQWLQASAGRALWLNGSEVAWALDAKADAAGGAWLQTWFGARFAADGAGVYTVSGSGGLSGSWTFDDGSHHSYNVDSADTFALKGATALLAYGSGKGNAATLFSPAPGNHTVLVGVPLETVYPASDRASLFKQLLQVSAIASVCDTPGTPDGAPDAGLADSSPADTSAPAADALADDLGGANPTDTSGQSDTSPGDIAKSDLAVAETAGGDGASALADIGQDSQASAVAKPSSPSDSGCRAGTGSANGGVRTALALVAAVWILSRRRALQDRAQPRCG